jgi:hypothetical protein
MSDRTTPDQPQPQTCPWGTHLWAEQPAADRPGWWRVLCQVCGKFYGYRPEHVPRPRAGEPVPGGLYR